jgi:hypothetical protein
MSKITDDDISNLLNQWYDAKDEISKLEKSIDKYKKLADKIMNSNDTNIIKSGEYTLRKSDISKMTISKRDVPENVWEKYAKKCSYPAYYLTKK